MSGLAIVTHIPGSMVMRNGLSPTQPWVIRLFSALSIMRFNDGRGSLTVYARVSPFLPAAARFPSVCHPFMSTPIGFLGAILNFSLVPICYSRVGHLVPGVCRHLPPFRRGSFPESGWVSHIASMQVVFSSLGMGGTSPPGCSIPCFLGSGC
jgi:hypothetical protein